MKPHQVTIDVAYAPVRKSHDFCTAPKICPYVRYERREHDNISPLIPPCPPAHSFLCDPSLLEESLNIPMLVDLMKKHKTPVQAACLGVIQNLSLTSDFHQQLLAQGVLEALNSTKDVDGGVLSAQCAAVLYNFSLHEKSITQMMDLGGIFLVTHLSYSNVVKVSKHFVR